MKLVQLKFVGLFKNDYDNNSFVCVLEENASNKRKLYVKMSQEEADEILKYIQSDDSSVKCSVPENLSDFIKEGYKVSNINISFNCGQQVGIANICKNTQKLQILINLCSVIFLMLNYNVKVFTKNESFDTLNNNFELVSSKFNDIDNKDDVLSIIDDLIYENKIEQLKIYEDYVKNNILSMKKECS
jgi:hypothetical protein